MGIQVGWVEVGADLGGRRMRNLAVLDLTFFALTIVALVVGHIDSKR